MKESNLSMPSQASGTGSQYYLEPSGPGIAFGSVWKYITSGVDPYYYLSNTTASSGSYYHGFVQFKFNTPDNWDYNYTSSSIAANKIDFYSVVLHEAIHTLGFATAIIANVGSTAIPNKLTFYDTWLENTQGISIVSFTDNCYAASFSGIDISDDCNIRFNNNNGFTHAIFSPMGFSQGSSLSHVNCNYLPVPGYVMNWSITAGYVQRSPHPYEIDILTCE